MPEWTAWDTRVAIRALAIAVIAFGVAWLVTATTDEGGVAWGVRAGRTLPLAPVCAALGSFVSLQQARARGEIRALEALGRRPWQSAVGVVLGGAAAAFIAATLVGSQPRVDVEGFFPVARHAAAFRYDAGGFVDAVAGVRVDPDGSLRKITTSSNGAAAGGRASPSPVPTHGRAAAALTIALSGLAFPLIAAEGLLVRRFVRRPKTARDRRTSLAIALVTAGLAVGASILLFQAAAVGRVPALLAPIPAALLLAQTAFRYRSA